MVAPQATVQRAPGQGIVKHHIDTRLGQTLAVTASDFTAAVSVEQDKNLYTTLPCLQQMLNKQIEYLA